MPARLATSETAMALSPDMTLTATPWLAKYWKVSGASARILFESSISASGMSSAVGRSSSSEPSYKPSSSTRQPLAEKPSICSA